MLAQIPFHAHACTDPEAVPLLVSARVSPSYTRAVPCQPLLSGACWIWCQSGCYQDGISI